MAKTKTTVQKTNKIKVVKPLYKVDLTNAETFDDVAIAFAMAKFEAKQPLDKRDLMAIIWEADVETAIELALLASTIIPAICQCKCEYKCKKQNIFKRFWNWLTRKK